MFFCPECDNSFNITKTLPQHKTEGQTGGDRYETFIKKTLANEDVEQFDTNGLTLDELTKSAEYKRLKQREKERVHNMLNELLPLDKKNLPKADKTKKHTAFYICTKCGYNEPIKSGTMIFSRTSNDVSQSYISRDIKEMVHSDILKRTRRYICPNKDCVSHKDIQQREAIMFRRNNSYQMIMICEACNTIV